MDQLAATAMLANAHRILLNIEQLDDRKSQVMQQTSDIRRNMDAVTKKVRKKISLMTKIVDKPLKYTIIGFFPFAILTTDLFFSVPLVGPVLWLAALACGIYWIYSIAPKQLPKMQQRNDEELDKALEPYRQQLISAQEKINAIDRQMKQLAIRFAQECANYPAKNQYAYSEAAAYFYNYVHNGQATTLGEAVTLYENHLHQERMEQGQQQMLRQQQVSNVINAVSGFATVSAINQNTAAVNRVASEAAYANRIR